MVVEYVRKRLVVVRTKHDGAYVEVLTGLCVPAGESQNRGTKHG